MLRGRCRRLGWTLEPRTCERNRHLVAKGLESRVWHRVEDADGSTASVNSLNLNSPPAPHPRIRGNRARIHRIPTCHPGRRRRRTPFSGVLRHAPVPHPRSRRPPWVFLEQPKLRPRSAVNNGFRGTPCSCRRRPMGPVHRAPNARSVLLPQWSSPSGPPGRPPTSTWSKIHDRSTTDPFAPIRFSRSPRPLQRPSPRRPPLRQPHRVRPRCPELQRCPRSQWAPATPTAASSAVAPHVDDPAEPIAAGREGASAQVPQNATEPPPTTGGYDWDAATAAALTDESADRVAPPHVHTTTTADRLLEDIIREIVGDAAVDDASSQLSDQSIPSNDVVRPTTTHGSEAASPPPAVASTTNRMSRPSESTPSAPSARPLVAADENGQNATATPEAPREPTATPRKWPCRAARTSRSNPHRRSNQVFRARAARPVTRSSERSEPPPPRRSHRVRLGSCGQ